jgi:hypothetical protein
VRNSCPIRLLNATSHQKPEAICLGEAYKDTRCITCSPVHNAALTLGGNGKLKMAIFATGKLMPLSDTRLDAVNWSRCSLGFSKDGMLGLALDGSGKLLGFKISACATN